MLNSIIAGTSIFVSLFNINSLSTVVAGENYKDPAYIPVYNIQQEDFTLKGQAIFNNSKGLKHPLVEYGNELDKNLEEIKHLNLSIVTNNEDRDEVIEILKNNKEDIFNSINNKSTEKREGEGVIVKGLFSNPFYKRGLEDECSFLSEANYLDVTEEQVFDEEGDPICIERDNETDDCIDFLTKTKKQYSFCEYDECLGSGYYVISGNDNENNCDDEYCLQYDNNEKLYVMPKNKIEEKEHYSSYEEFRPPNYESHEIFRDGIKNVTPEDGENLNQGDAYDFCNNLDLEFDNISNWRLPTKNELDNIENFLPDDKEYRSSTFSGWKEDTGYVDYSRICHNKYNYDYVTDEHEECTNYYQDAENRIPIWKTNDGYKEGGAENVNVVCVSDDESAIDYEKYSNIVRYDLSSLDNAPDAIPKTCRNIPDVSLNGNSYNKLIQAEGKNKAYVAPLSIIMDKDFENNPEKGLYFILNGQGKIDLTVDKGIKILTSLIKNNEQINIYNEYNEEYFEILQVGLGINGQEAYVDNIEESNIQKNPLFFYSTNGYQAVTIRQIKENPEQSKDIFTTGSPGENTVKYNKKGDSFSTQKIPMSGNNKTDIHFIGLNTELGFKKLIGVDEIEDYDIEVSNNIDGIISYLNEHFNPLGSQIRYCGFGGKNNFFIDELMFSCDGSDCNIFSKDGYDIREDYEEGFYRRTTDTYPNVVEYGECKKIDYIEDINENNKLLKDDFKIRNYVAESSNFNLGNADDRTTELIFDKQALDNIDKRNNDTVLYEINHNPTHMGLGLLGYTKDNSSFDASVAYNFDVIQKEPSLISYVTKANGVKNVYSQDNETNATWIGGEFNDSNSSFEDGILSREGSLSENSQEIEIKIKAQDPNFYREDIKIGLDGFLDGLTSNIERESSILQNNHEIRTYLIKLEGDFKEKIDVGTVNINIKDEYQEKINFFKEVPFDFSTTNVGMGFLKEGSNVQLDLLESSKKNPVFQAGLKEIRPQNMEINNFNMQGVDIESIKRYDFLVSGKVNLEFSVDGHDLTDKVNIQRASLKENSNIYDLDELINKNLDNSYINSDGNFVDTIELKNIYLQTYFDSLLNYYITVVDGLEKFDLKVKVDFKDLSYGKGFSNGDYVKTRPIDGKEKFEFVYKYRPSINSNNKANFSIYSPYSESGEILHFAGVNDDNDSDSQHALMRGEFKGYLDGIILNKQDNIRFKGHYYGDEKDSYFLYGDGKSEYHVDEIADNPVPHGYQYNKYNSNMLYPGSIATWNGERGQDGDDGENSEFRYRSCKVDKDVNTYSGEGYYSKRVRTTKDCELFSSTDQMDRYAHYENRLKDGCGNTQYDPYKGGNIPYIRLANNDLTKSVGKAYNRVDTVSFGFMLKTPTRLFKDRVYRYTNMLSIFDNNNGHRLSNNFINRKVTNTWYDYDEDGNIIETHEQTEEKAGVYITEEDFENRPEEVSKIVDFDLSSSNRKNYSLKHKDQLINKANFKLSLNPLFENKIKSIWIKPVTRFLPRLENQGDGRYRANTDIYCTRGHTHESQRNCYSLKELAEITNLDFNKNELNPQSLQQGLYSSFESFQVHITLKDCTNGASDLSCLKNNNDELQRFLSEGEDKNTKDQVFTLDFPIKFNGAQSFLDSFKPIDDNIGTKNQYMNSEQEENGEGTSAIKINNFLDYVLSLGDANNRLTEYYYGFNMAKKHYTEYFAGKVKTEYDFKTSTTYTVSCGEFSCSKYCGGPSPRVSNEKSELVGEIKNIEGRTYYYFSNFNEIEPKHSFEGGEIWKGYNSVYAKEGGYNNAPDLKYNLLDGKGSYGFQVSNIGNEVVVHGENKYTDEETSEIQNVLLGKDEELQDKYKKPSLQEYYLNNNHFPKKHVNTMTELREILEDRPDNPDTPTTIIFEGGDNIDFGKEGGLKIDGKYVIIFKNNLNNKLSNVNIRSDIRVLDKDLKQKVESQLSEIGGSDINRLDILDNPDYNFDIVFDYDIIRDDLRNNRGIILGSNFNINAGVKGLENLMLITDSDGTIKADYSNNPLLIQGHVVTNEFNCYRNVNSLYFGKLGDTSKNNYIIGEKTEDPILGNVNSYSFYVGAKTQGCSIIESPALSNDYLQTVPTELGEEIKN